MDKLHELLVAACKVVAAGNRIVLQPEDQGGSFIEDRTKRSIRAPVLGRQRKFTKTVGASGRVVPKRPAGLPVSPVTSAEESGPVRADEFGPVRVDEFADEDMVQEAEELSHAPAPVLPSKAEVEAHNVSHLPFRSWCSACVRGRGLSLGHRRVDATTKEAEQIPTFSVDCGRTKCRPQGCGERCGAGHDL